MRLCIHWQTWLTVKEILTWVQLRFMYQILTGHDYLGVYSLLYHVDAINPKQTRLGQKETPLILRNLDT